MSSRPFFTTGAVKLCVVGANVVLSIACPPCGTVVVVVAHVVDSADCDIRSSPQPM